MSSFKGGQPSVVVPIRAPIGKGDSSFPFPPSSNPRFTHSLQGAQVWKGETESGRPPPPLQEADGGHHPPAPAGSSEAGRWGGGLGRSVSPKASLLESDAAALWAPSPVLLEKEPQPHKEGGLSSPPHTHTLGGSRSQGRLRAPWTIFSALFCWETEGVGGAARGASFCLWGLRAAGQRLGEQHPGAEVLNPKSCRPRPRPALAVAGAGG